MKIQNLLIALTGVNLVLLVFLLAQAGTASAQDTAPVLRGRALEIVDDQGRTRVTLKVEPEYKTADGETSPEMVLFRMIDRNRRPAVKISVSDEGSGMSLTGGAQTHATYVTLGSSGTTSTVRLRNEDGREQTIKP